ncbi:tRNA uridine-5-carboxymethylaminomethyl(34) synthesis GTPase MnmE [Candidatus Xianfuyuplasma coldseepsis]|uniref:tRNA modification GTPase MnmE n=1 Tax=Candidatus Xianfuyuplasma coldseepsis TaxID=2782163 RepID=A0A7L7KQ98_9MOLU|nr:tRNA uridine-5-carboxymethylaminomethyl(34) synthesis GTPase MnmE [Xianfuyuplasma coldseepsis]QMS84970.1 tRNA uridine-5-carboxymethylaminomethyl(34) synthesis GTPase MnmE [Xianfuyuplasma coldseepsis]
MNEDTIVAISTALGQGAISIVRLSGDNAINLVNSRFEGVDLTIVPSHTIHYGHIVNNDNHIDEVLISVFRAPRSFTTENLVEIHCHGGVFVANKILELMLISGARAAQPGEFTERAFLNGRIDLTQAEAVMDIIEAKSDMSLTLANKGLDGVIYKLITDLRTELLNIIANIEVNIDYPEYDDVEQLSNEILKPAITSLESKISTIIEQSHFGKIIRDGIKTAIIGRPNVGKSSILNALLREDKAIVTEIQGTTRDIVEGTVNIGGIILNLIDTAGIRDSEDIVEKIGIDKAKAVIEEAELILFVLDNNQPLTDEDKALLEATNHKKRIVIINKNDLSRALTHSFENSVEISALHKQGIDQLESKIRDMFLSGTINVSDQTYVSNARHIAKLTETKQALTDSLASIEMQMPVDMVEIDLKNAWILLGDIIGDNSSTSLLDELFSKFCLGK